MHGQDTWENLLHWIKESRHSKKKSSSIVIHSVSLSTFLGNIRSYEITLHKVLSNQIYLSGHQFCYCGQQFLKWHTDTKSLLGLYSNLLGLLPYSHAADSLAELRGGERLLMERRPSSYSVLRQFLTMHLWDVFFQTLLPSMFCYPLGDSVSGVNSHCYC